MALEREFKVSRPTILKWIKQRGITEHWYKAKYIDKDLVLKMYSDGISVLKIANELNVGRRPIENILKQNSIKKRNNSEALIGRYGGNKNPNYKGGCARHILGEIPKFNRVQNVWSQMILSLDNFECKMCGETRGMLNAHHIIPVRKIYRENLNFSLLVALDNGITLCRKCHLSIHMREEQVAEQFQNLVKNRVNSVNTLVQDHLQGLLNSALGKYRAKRTPKRNTKV